MNHIFLITGRSGSGKTSIVNKVVEMTGLHSIESYTTRPKRFDNETGHIFISDDEFDKLTGICAYTMINGYRYCTTSDEVDKNDLYIIDPDGIDYFKKNYNGQKIPVIVKIEADRDLCIKRMKDRGDSIETINKRISDFDDAVFDNFKDYDILIPNSTYDVEHAAEILIREIHDIEKQYIDKVTQYN